VVLNWEATGNAGPSVLFETSLRDAELVRVLAASAPSPVGDFALVDGTAYYHSSQDTLADLDLRSVQHTGETMRALTRALGNRDLPGLSATDDATFFLLSAGWSPTRSRWPGWPCSRSPPAPWPRAGCGSRRWRACSPRGGRRLHLGADGASTCWSSGTRVGLVD
jgi:hypothetical protein